MKKVIIILVTLLMAVSLMACVGNNKPAESTIPDTTNATEKASIPEISNSETEKESNEAESEKDTNKVKTLVAYFSATNTTKTLAEYVADELNADIYEIVPETPYTTADLNYNNDKSRSTIEMNDPSSRPAISNSVENMEQYDIIFVGYPIWWSEAPRIIDTFLESYDFNGKTIIPFCTSGGSGIGSSATKLEGLTKGANWLSGRRFSGGTSRDEMVEWVNSLGLDVTVQ